MTRPSWIFPFFFTVWKQKIFSIHKKQLLFFETDNIHMWRGNRSRKINSIVPILKLFSQYVASVALIKQQLPHKYHHRRTENPLLWKYSWQENGSGYVRKARGTSQQCIKLLGISWHVWERPRCVLFSTFTFVVYLRSRCVGLKGATFALWKKRAVGTIRSICVWYTA